MRQRSVSPSFFTSDQVIGCSFPARLLFVGLWCLADREGKLRDEPRRIKRQVFPDDRVDISRLLDELLSAGLILRYPGETLVGTLDCILIPGFLGPHGQRPHPHEAPSVLPDAPSDLKSRDISRPDQPMVDPAVKRSVPARRILRPSDTQAFGVSDTLTSAAADTAAASFTETWNQNCAPLPRMLRPPTRREPLGLVRGCWEAFGGDGEGLAAAVRRCAADDHYRTGGFGFEAFCRHADRFTTDRPTAVIVAPAPAMTEAQRRRQAEREEILRRHSVPTTGVVVVEASA